VPPNITCDPTRLQQILVNLIGNAVKFTERGEVFIDVTVRRPSSETEGATLGFSVRDSGIGIPLEKQSALFQPFIQVESSTARRFGGTGLGLAISRRLVELLGGEIGVESAAGQGAEILLPSAHRDRRPSQRDRFAPAGAGRQTLRGRRRQIRRAATSCGAWLRPGV